MFRVIAYDIPSEARRRKIQRICCDYGVRQQYSVFVCDLEDEHWISFLECLRKIILPAEDSIVVFPLCGKCRAGQILLGRGQLYEKPACYLF